MPPEINTLEEARAEIIRLNELLSTANTERENYSTQVSDLNRELESVRKLNQEYFLKLSAQYTPNAPEDAEDDDTLTCEDFARTLNI